MVSAKAGGAVGTSPAGTFPANGYGLYRHDRQRLAVGGRLVSRRPTSPTQAKVSKRRSIPRGPARSYDPDDRGVPVEAPKRVTRGGSFLCNVDYCLSYRPSARRGTDPYNPMSHLGFRLVMDEADWKKNVPRRCCALSIAASLLPGARLGAGRCHPGTTATRRQRIVTFVHAVTDEKSKDYVAAAERIATFDNDGTLWAEQPMYFQFAFVLDRRSRRRRRSIRSGRTSEPFGR